MRRQEEEWRKNMELSIKDWQDKYREAYDNYAEVLKNGKDNESAYEGTRKIKTPTGGHKSWICK